MIQSLSVKYKKHISWSLFLLFYLQLIAPVYAANIFLKTAGFNIRNVPYKIDDGKTAKYPIHTKKNVGNIEVKSDRRNTKTQFNALPHALSIGGPASPEATSFKAVGADNLVNLFSGDFSYSIPLLDVGGYPVNLFYSGGITMDQEASWVGLGWNINPGTVSRNMRGIPDDFNGTDLLTQTQNVKPNRTWAGEIGIDAELLGIKPHIPLSLGFSYNNYLGPAIELGASTAISLVTMKSVGYEKSASPSIGLGLKLNSRSGLTLSPSLNANLKIIDGAVGAGLGISTSYNSRTGIKDITISSGVNIVKGDNLGSSVAASISDRLRFGRTISFARQTYLPTLRMPMENSYSSGKIELGGAAFGYRGSVTANGSYTESKVAPEAMIMTKPLVGFMYLENAVKNKNAVMDFNRLGDGEVTPNTPIISAPQYAYDVFSIQGEGTGGSVRAYRGDLGFMRDNVTTSKDRSITIGLDIAPPGHYGINVNKTATPTRVGGWEDGNNTLIKTSSFKPITAGSSFENVYFKNPAEATVANDKAINLIGGDNLVRFKLGGSKTSPRLETGLETFNKKTGSSNGAISLLKTTEPEKREKRTQVTTMLTALEASQVGLEKTIRNYSGGFNADVSLSYTNILRMGDSRKPHHISEIDVLESNGMRYVYGIPVYNVSQKDFTFSVGNVPKISTQNLVAYDTSSDPKLNSSFMNNSSKIDGYVQTQETPGYAASFLITGLLSPDYVDITGDGISEDDLGGAVKFDYTKSADLHKWRTPRNNTAPAVAGQDFAHFNEGLRTEKRDNKATISYGERESWYLSSIESKSMVAIFKTTDRNDAKGVKSALNGTVNAVENANKKLSRIDLYTKAEIKAKGISNARPLKSVFFDYGYDLCKGSPDNANGGKLTLKDVYFTYNGQLRKSKSLYVFNYGDIVSPNSTDNPGYKYNAADRWGTYKDSTTSYNPANLSNLNFPFTDTSKVRDDGYAGAWSLKKILLPTGGQMEMQYEADDYAYVQDRRACNMMQLYGLGNTTTSTTSNSLYVNGDGLSDNYYAYIKLPVALNNTDPVKRKREIFTKYIESLNQIVFKLLIDMPRGSEPLIVYANYDDYGFCTNTGNTDIIYIKLRPVDGKSPLAKSAVEFITGNLPGQAFPGYDAEINGLPDFLNLVAGMLGSFLKVTQNVDEQMRSVSNARTVRLGSSFVRLANAARIKIGGGSRIKKVLLRDNWNKMTGQYNSVYGQDYDYTTSEKVDGISINISSGVASYEPGIGSEENPFREIISFSNKLPLASALYGAIEMPLLEALYPSAMVGYSKVTVRSIHRKGTHGDSAVRSAIGKQVTEFFTARDYPSFSCNTPMNSMEYPNNPILSFFNKQVINRRTISQGFLVETNDMHGKMKAQAAYSESDEKTPLSASFHYYRNTGKNGLNDQVNFVYNDQGGLVKKGNMGIDMELMTDVREFSVKSNAIDIEFQADLFAIYPITTLYALPAYQENLYRAVTCTKLINYHAIEDSVVVMDKGSVVSTKTIAYDAETGNAILTQTANEFNDSIYSVNYPAYWAYSGTGPAYKNIGLTYNNVSFLNGKIISGIDISTLESGDELYVTKVVSVPEAVLPKMSGTVAYNCSATNNGQGSVSLSFTFPVPTPSSFRFNVGWVYQDNSGYGSGGVKLPDYAKPQGNDIFFIDVPAGVTAYTTPAPLLSTAANGSSKNSWTCFDGLSNLSNFYKKAFVLKIAGASNFISDIVCTTPGLLFQNDISNLPPLPVSCVTESNMVSRLWVFDNNKNNTALSVPVKDFVVMDSIGKLYSKSGVNIKIIRSGKRNNLALTVSNATCRNNPIQNNFLVVDNSDNVIAASAIEYKEKWQVDNDVMIRKLYTIPPCSTIETESIDCSGILEKNINPYVKGLVGNLKPYRSYTYYGSRNELDVSLPTTIRKNGYLNNFSNYWGFNGLNNLVPDYTNSKWVWNSELTRVNAKGQELETKDALNRYTAAQYGFNKNMPVALVQNARNGESFSEGFEDINYAETLNAAVLNTCDINKYFSLNGLANSTIINTETSALKAHSGKYALKVNPNAISSKRLFVKSLVMDNFWFAFKKDTTKQLVDMGGAISRITANPTTGREPIFNTSNLGMDINFSGGNVIGEVINNSYVRYAQSYKTLQYFKILVPNTYTFNLQTFIGDVPLRYEESSVSARSELSLVIKNEDRTIVGEFYLSNPSSPKSNSVYLNCGIYTIEGSAVFNIERSYNGSDGFHAFQSSCGYSSNVNVTSFKSLSTQNGCIKSLPFIATDSMLNQSFALVPGKRMQFSAWVREASDSLVNYRPAYIKNHIELQFSGGNPVISFSPKGNIIEGWQKIEGEFTVPANANTANLVLSNDGSQLVYFDDIRIHPFSANMKSYVYEERTLKLTAELDENNYASFYEYDEEGQLVRVKKETIQGIKTIKETRNAKQKSVPDLQ